MGLLDTLEDVLALLHSDDLHSVHVCDREGGQYAAVQRDVCVVTRRPCVEACTAHQLRALRALQRRVPPTPHSCEWLSWVW